MAIALIALIPGLCHAAPVITDPDMKACKELDGDKAIAVCSRVLQSEPLSKDREIEARELLGANQTNTAHFDDAIANFTRAIALDPKKSSAYSGRGVAYANKKQFDKAFADFSTAIKTNPNNAAAYLARCQVYSLQKKFELALSDCDKLVSLKPKVGLAWGTRGLVHLRHHDDDLAVADLNRAIQLEPKNPRFYWFRAMAFRDEREDAKALADDVEATELNPDDWRMVSDLSLDLVAVHRQDGLAILDRLVRRHPRAAPPYYFRGEAYGQQNKLKEAIVDLNTYIRLKPEDAAGYSMRGKYLEEAGEYTAATADFSDAIKREKSPTLLSAEYESRCGSRVESGEELDAGIADCNRALHMDNGRWEAYTGRGFAEFRQRKYAAALADFNKRIALQFEPENPPQAFGQSIANFLTGRSIADLPSYPRGSMLAANVATAFCGRALTKAKMGDAGGSLGDLGAANKFDPASVAKCKRLYGGVR